MCSIYFILFLKLSFVAHTLSPSPGEVEAGEISSSGLAGCITEFSRSAMTYTVNLCLKTVNKPLPFLGQI